MAPLILHPNQTKLLGPLADADYTTPEPPKGIGFAVSFALEISAGEDFSQQWKFPQANFGRADFCQSPVTSQRSDIVGAVLQ